MRSAVLPAAALACAALAAAPPAPAQDGEPDYSFGIFAITELPPVFQGEDSYLSALCVQPDGRILVFGSTSGGESVSGWRLERDGRIDGDFAFDDFWPGFTVEPIGAAVLPDRRIFLGATLYGTEGSQILTWMMDPDGNPDLSYGDGGWLVLDLPLDLERLQTVGLGPGGTLLLGSYGYNPSPFVSRYVVMITRLLANGDPDPSWSFSGHRQFEWRAAPAAGDASVLGALALLPDGSLLAAGSLANATLGTDHAVIGKIGPTGGFDGTYGTSGRTFLNWSTLVAQPEDLRAFGIAPLPNGRAILGVALQSGAGSSRWTGIARLTELGSPDSTYGFGGLYLFNFAPGSDAFPTGLAADAGGAAVVSGYSRDASLGWAFGVARIGPDGFEDGRFAGGGTVTYNLDAGLFTDGAEALALHNDGGILLGGSTQISDHMGGLVDAMVVLRLHGGLPFTDDFETTDFFFWNGP